MGTSQDHELYPLSDTNGETIDSTSKRRTNNTTQDETSSRTSNDHGTIVCCPCCISATIKTTCQVIWLILVILVVANMLKGTGIFRRIQKIAHDGSTLWAVIPKAK